MRQTTLAPVCISLNIDTELQGPRESHVGIPGEDRWAGRRFPYIQVIPIVHMCCDTQYMCSPLHGIPNPPVAVHVYQQSSRASHPLNPTAAAFVALWQKLIFQCLQPTTANSQSTNSLGFLLLCDRLHHSTYTISVRCKYRADT